MFNNKFYFFVILLKICLFSTLSYASQTSLPTADDLSSLNSKFMMQNKSDLENLPSFKIDSFPMQAAQLRQQQITTVVEVYKKAQEKNINICNAKIMEVGMGHPSALLTIQLMRKEKCDHLEEITGVDLKIPHEWGEYFKAFNINLIESSIGEISLNEKFDIIFAVDVLKKSDAFNWGTYHYAKTDGENLREHLDNNGFILAANDFKEKSILNNFASENEMHTQEKIVFAGTQEYRDIFKTIYGELFGQMTMTTHSSNCLQ